eukprot:TRINITY_DN51676_c0_g1_i1.p1 TRINITY_DN51676_c0_g1~~TRINITY_DN51676_c0_g1_i1.p1  ORF type:complete len:415 (+),score=57.04 TRINITY_DN51676_c0_g1_i1:64-1308(+)
MDCFKTPSKVSTVPDKLSVCEEFAEISSSSDEESATLMPGGVSNSRRACTDPSLCARDLMEQFPPALAGSVSSVGFGSPYQQIRTACTGSRRRRSANQSKLQAIASKLRNDDFQFLGGSFEHGLSLPNEESIGRYVTAFQEKDSKFTGPASALQGDVDDTFGPEETIILFDWDDTLFPTHYVMNVVNAQLGSPETWDTIPEDSEFYAPLQHHAVALRRLLGLACTLGKVSIVTLSQRPWLLNSIRRYLPCLDIEELQDELDISVHYALEYVRPSMMAELRSAIANDEGIDLYTLASHRGMYRATKSLLRKLSRVNIVSIGDSVAQRSALTELSWSEKVKCPEVFCKTVLLMGDPSVSELDQQLQVLEVLLPKLAQQPGDENIDFDTSECGDESPRSTLTSTDERTSPARSRSYP